MNHAELRLSAALERLSLPRFYSCLFRIFSRNPAGKSSNSNLCFTRFLKALFFFQGIPVSILKHQSLAAPESHRRPESPPIAPPVCLPAVVFQDQEWWASGPCPNQQMTWVKWLQKPDLPPQVSSSVEAEPLQFLLISSYPLPYTDDFSILLLFPGCLRCEHRSVTS